VRDERVGVVLPAGIAGHEVAGAGGGEGLAGAEAAQPVAGDVLFAQGAAGAGGGGGDADERGPAIPTRTVPSAAASATSAQEIRPPGAAARSFFAVAGARPTTTGERMIAVDSGRVSPPPESWTRSRKERSEASQARS
jgi:hypothetical protein